MFVLPVPCGVEREDELGQNASEADNNKRQDDTPVLRYMQ